MATVVIPEINLFEPETAVVEPTPGTLTSADTGTVAGAADLVLRVTNGATPGHVTVAAGQAAALVISVAASKTAYIPLDDSSYYQQVSDGLMHVTVDQTMTAVALIR